MYLDKHIFTYVCFPVNLLTPLSDKWFAGELDHRLHDGQRGPGRRLQPERRFQLAAQRGKRDWSLWFLHL